MENKKFFINFKMNLTKKETEEYLQNIKGKIKKENVIFFPSNLYSYAFLKENYNVGIQNISKEEKGAYTGEVSAYQAASLGITYALVGHSERRNLFHEKNEDIGKKIDAALQNKMNAILCIGETLKEKKMHKEKKVLKKQIEKALKHIEKKEKIIIAYEPVWAIGSMKNPSIKEITEIIMYIKKVLLTLYPDSSIPILYGGSIHEENIKALSKIEEVDGFLIGSASLDYKKLLSIIEVAVPM